MAPPQISRTAHHLQVVARARLLEAQRLIAADLLTLRTFVGRNAVTLREKTGEIDLPRERALGVAAVLILSVSATGLALNATLSSSEPAAVAPAETADPLGGAVTITNVSDGKDGRSFVLAGGIPLFPLPAGSMRSKADTPVEAQDVTVLSTVPGVGFWVGNNVSERVFVSPRPQSGPDSREVALPEMQVGQMVNFSGYVRVLPDQADDLGLVDPTDIAQLDAQGYRIEANSIRPQ